MHRPAFFSFGTSPLVPDYGRVGGSIGKDSEMSQCGVVGGDISLEVGFKGLQDHLLPATSLCFLCGDVMYQPPQAPMAMTSI